MGRNVALQAASQSMCMVYIGNSMDGKWRFTDLFKQKLLRGEVDLRFYTAIMVIEGLDLKVQWRTTEEQVLIDLEIPEHSGLVTVNFPMYMIGSIKSDSIHIDPAIAIDSLKQTK